VPRLGSRTHAIRMAPVRFPSGKKNAPSPPGLAESSRPGMEHSSSPDLTSPDLITVAALYAEMRRRLSRDIESLRRRRPPP
jgi:hypothetical protein